MSAKRLLPYAVTAFLTLAAGCGGSDKSSNNSTGNSGSTLTDVEFSSMMDALSEVGSFAFSLDRKGTPLSTGLAAQQSQSIPIDESSSCPGGGTIRVAGNVSYSTSGQSFTYDGNLTQTYSNCKGTSHEGTVFTFNGNPNLTLALHMTYNQSTGTYTYTLTESGGISWSSSGSKSGGCSVSLNVSANYNAAGVYTGTVSGNICGRSVNESI